jgi:serine/threonine-protein kinase
MSPEQARGQRVDRRTDIWAFGCVLFELLTGCRAFDGPTSSDVIAAVLEHEPDWARLPTTTPPSLRRLLTRCLTKDPRRRLRDIGDALADLEEMSPATPDSAAPPASTRAVRRWQTAALVAGALLALTGWLLLRPATPSVTPGRFALAFPPQAPLRLGGAEADDVAISADGSRIAYTTTGGLAVRFRDRLEVAVIDLPGENPTSPFFSPDGNWIGYTSASTLRKVASTGGPSTLVAATGNAAVGSWGPDDIVYTDAQGMYRVPADGGTPKPIALGLAAQEQATFPHVLPDGHAVLFTVVPTRSNTPGAVANEPNARVEAIDLASGTRTTVVRGGGNGFYVRSGHLAFVAGRSLRAVAFDPAALAARGEPAELLSEAAASFAVAADDGTLTYIGGRTRSLSTLVWVDREGREEPLGTPAMQYVYPRLSPDERRVALDVGGPNRDIYIWDLSKRVLERFTTDPAEEAIVRWTPDGTRLAFASSRTGVPNIFWQPADGSGPAERVFESPGLQHPTAFTRDGRVVVTEIAPGGGRGLGVLSLTPPRRVTPLLQNAINGEVSPDGRWLAFASSESGQHEVYVTSFPDSRGRSRISLNGGRQPAWSHDGRELFYRDFQGALVAVPVTLSRQFSAGTGRTLFSNAAYRGAGAAISDRTYDVTADGRRFLMIRGADQGQPTLVVVQAWIDELARRLP